MKRNENPENKGDNKKRGQRKKGTGYFFLKKLPVPFFLSLVSAVFMNNSG